MRKFLFVFGAIQAIAGLITILAFFGFKSQDLQVHLTMTALPSIWWLVAAILLFIGSFSLSGYGLYKLSLSQRTAMPAATPPMSQDARRALIERWRAMITEVHRTTRATPPRRAPLAASVELPPEPEPKSVTELLESHPAFPSIRAYLSDKSKTSLHGRVMVVAPSGSAMDGKLHYILDDIDRLEREWGLRL